MPGYPPLAVPDPCFIRNNSSAKLHPSFVEEVFSKLLVADCIEEHFELPYCVNPLSVAEGKKLSRLSLTSCSLTLAFSLQALV